MPRSGLLIIGLLFVIVLLSGSVLSAQEWGETQDAKPAPPLSLETLFHPDNKFDFDGSLPATHWIGQSASTLLQRGKETWVEVDPLTGATTPWPVVDQLAEQLADLDPLDAKKAQRAANSAVTKMREVDDVVLVKIDKGLALVSASKPARWLTRDASKWQHPTLDPTKRRVAYTRDGDLFLLDASSGRSLQLTNDGTDTILDGVLDWTYQEEIFGRGNYRGFWFSPDGEWLAMLRIDISAIEPYVLPSASSERGAGLVRRYPKAGDPIPHAELHIWDLRQFDSGVVPPSQFITGSTPQDERIITGVWWNPHHFGLLVSVSDRLQTWRELRLCTMDVLSGAQPSPTLLIREESPAWVEPPSAPGWLPDGSLVWRSELPTGRSRLYRISPSGQEVTPLTPRDFDVHDHQVRDDGSFAVVTGDADRGAVERHAYRIDVDSDRPSVLVPLTDKPGWHATSVSPDGKWLVDRYSTTTKPPELRVRSVSNDQETLLAASELKLREAMRKPEVFSIPTPDGIELPALLVRPEAAQDDNPCPVVVEIYGGPRAPVVSSRWGGTKSLYRELLARRGIAVLAVDNRSSAGRGIADTWSIQGRVGEIEFQDLMTAVGWLKEQPWVDSQRLAIRGWSFGGFMTLYAMTHSDAFVAGIAGGSVTDWREYDAFYTERYMGLPEQNAEGYDSTAPLAAAEQLSGRVLMIHGESDDNVHPSNTLRMARALQHAGKDFRLMIYPGAAHAIHDPRQAWHMNQMVHRFLTDELLVTPEPVSPRRFSPSGAESRKTPRNRADNGGGRHPGGSGQKNR